MEQGYTWGGNAIGIATTGSKIKVRGKVSPGWLSDALPKEIR